MTDSVFCAVGDVFFARQSAKSEINQQTNGTNVLHHHVSQQTTLHWLFIGIQSAECPGCFIGCNNLHGQ